MGLTEFKCNNMIRMADRSISRPLDILEDVPVQVGKLFIPFHFVVLNIPEDTHIPIILGRPFLHTAGALIDVGKKTLTSKVGGDELVYKHSSIPQFSMRVDSNLVVSISVSPISIASVEYPSSLAVGRDMSSFVGSDVVVKSDFAIVYLQITDVEVLWRFFLVFLLVQIIYRMTKKLVLRKGKRYRQNPMMLVMELLSFQDFIRSCMSQYLWTFLMLCGQTIFLWEMVWCGVPRSSTEVKVFRQAKRVYRQLCLWVPFTILGSKKTRVAWKLKY
ncbi:hypothetical protein vseg_005920 [Gypsophila vaccaria]